ncbi:hypothetical protein WA158_001602 [Blastocystis sp. Blastoise]
MQNDSFLMSVAILALRKEILSILETGLNLIVFGIFGLSALKYTPMACFFSYLVIGEVIVSCFLVLGIIVIIVMLQVDMTDENIIGEFIASSAEIIYTFMPQGWIDLQDSF